MGAILMLITPTCAFFDWYVPQSIFLIDTSILENIAFSFEKEEADFSRVQDAAQAPKSINLFQFVSPMVTSLMLESGC